MPPEPEQLSTTIESLYRTESGRALAMLMRLLGDLDLAEEAMHEAIAVALESWPQTGIPDKPRPWLISSASIAGRTANVIQTDLKLLEIAESKA